MENEELPLWVTVFLTRPYVKRMTKKRFLTWAEAIKFASSKTGKTISNERWTKSGRRITLFDSVKVQESVNYYEYARWLKNNRHKSKKSIRKFISKNILKLPGLQDDKFFDIMAQTDPMEREVRILSYKLKNLDKFPEVKKLLEA